MERDLILAENESAGLLFSAARAYCLSAEEIVWMGEAMGTWQIPPETYIGILFNNNMTLRRKLLRDLDICAVQMLYFHNPFEFYFDDMLEDLMRREQGSLNTTPDDEDCALISSLHGLRAINLTCSNVSDQGLKLICEVQSLESLALSGTNISDYGLSSLSQLVDIRELDLSLTMVTDEGLQKLAALKNLEELRLASTGITEEGIMHLLQLHKLKFLDVSETAIAEEGVAILQAGLGECQIGF